MRRARPKAAERRRIIKARGNGRREGEEEDAEDPADNEDDEDGEDEEDEGMTLKVYAPSTPPPLTPWHHSS